MLKRIVTGVLALAIFVPVLYFSGSVAFPIVMALLAGIASWEFFDAVSQKKSFVWKIPIVAICAIMPLIARFYPELLLAFVALEFLYIFILLTFLYPSFNAAEAAMSVFNCFYTGLCFAFIVLIRDAQNLGFLLIFIAAWSTDTAAYFGGMALGKKKLCPSLSPKKTVAGAVCGVIGCAIGFFVFMLVANKWFGGNFGYVNVLWAIPASVISQLGDLGASAIKRQYNIKDYGKIFPGHGGVLDRFDSILAISAGMYIITVYGALV